MAHELWLLKGGRLVNITPLVGSLSWRSNINELGTELNFTLATGDFRHMPKNPIDLDGVVILRNGKNEITRCKIISEDKKGRQAIGYNAFDFSFYLNKSKRRYQFNKVSATKAIQRICIENNVPIYQIANMNTRIDKIYPGDTLSDIIKDIIEQVEQDSGHKYIFEMRLGKFQVRKASDMLIRPKIQLTNESPEHHATSIISNPTKTRSIENMKNRIQLVSNGKLITQISDQSLINIYGLLSDVIEIDKEDIAKAKNIARNTLKELGRVFETTSIELLGNDLVLAGRIIEVEEPITGMSGRYTIENVQHTVSNGIHRMKVDMKGVR